MLTSPLVEGFPPTPSSKVRKFVRRDRVVATAGQAPGERCGERNDGPIVGGLNRRPRR
jgi:hypothetical protein